MAWFKRLVWVVLALVVLVGAAAALYVQRSFPQLDGEIRAAGLGGPVTLARDASDVTHIKAGSARDAWFALGYVHAQERGWQLEFNRRVMHGELSEVFGEATLETDKLLRSLNVMDAARRQWAGMPAEAKDALQAYSDGINTFYATSSQALPPEFHILRVKPGRWEPLDSMGWSTMMALDLGGNMGTEFARLMAAREVPTERLWQLFPPYPSEPAASDVDFAKLYRDLGVYRSTAATATKTTAAIDAPVRRAALTSGMAEGMQAWAEDLSANVGTVDGKGSNEWVIGGAHTASGKPLLANDPHLGLSAPAIWYFAHLEAPGLNAIGATLPGLPFVVLGRTDKVAWGFTNTGPDVQDLYLEQINPDNPKQYRTPDGWAEFKSRTETIKVKNQPDVTVVLRDTRHGPVLSDAQKSHGEVLDLSKYVLALRWAALDSDNMTVASAIKSNRAQSAKELVASFAEYHSPMQNLVVADVGGAIGYRAIGKVPLRAVNNDIKGIAPSPGWDAKYDWTGWIPFDETPADDGAAKGWIATANQRITPPGYPYFMGQDWTVPYRFDRIEQMLAATPQHDMASVQKMHGDQLSLATKRMLPVLQKTESKHPLAAAALEKLKAFDSVMAADSAAPLIFAVWMDELTRGLVAPKVTEPVFKAIYGKRTLRGLVEQTMLGDDPYWCDKMTCPQQSTAALDRALDRLQAMYGPGVSAWRWGQAHPALSQHRPFGNVAALAKYFDVRVPTGGDTFTVNVGQYWPNDEKNPFANRHAASMRAIYDLADLENSRFIYQTGQSGLVFSDRYRDMSAEWAGVQYRALKMKPGEMKHTATMLP